MRHAIIRSLAGHGCLRRAGSWLRDVPAWKMQVSGGQSTSSSQGRSYEDALRILNSRQRQRRPNVAATTEQAVVPATLSGTPDLKGSPGIVGMQEWLRYLGHSAEDIDSLNIIHVAGTKGKGSTCAFAEAFLRSHGRCTGLPRKTGLYTSPHLMRVEERIRIDGEQLSQARFAQYFFEVYDRLPQLKSSYDASKDVVQRGPRYLQLLALLAFHTFIKEKVDVMILETHCGGEYDATNVIQRPLVTAVTALGMDHVDMLGPTIENIAWHKAGIFKRGAVALSAPQVPLALDVLRQRSSQMRNLLQVVESDGRLPASSAVLQPGVQRINASLALAAAQAWLKQSGFGESIQNIQESLQHFSWPGRFQTISDGEDNWYLDAAHNSMSVEIAARWFGDATRNKTQKLLSRGPMILIFSHINELRDSTALLDHLGRALISEHVCIDHVIFSTYDETSDNQRHNNIESKFELFHSTWAAVDPKTKLWNEPTIQGAIALAKRLSSNGMHTLITGSQHLVGPSLGVLRWHPKNHSTS